MTDRYYARSASDKTDDWPFWFVADRHRGGLNVTAEVARKLSTGDRPHAVLRFRDDALKLADRANAEITEAGND